MILYFIICIYIYLLLLSSLYYIYIYDIENHPSSKRLKAQCLENGLVEALAPILHQALQRGRRPMKPLEIYGDRMGIIGNLDDFMAFLLRGIDGDMGCGDRMWDITIKVCLWVSLKTRDFRYKQYVLHFLMGKTVFWTDGFRGCHLNRWKPAFAFTSCLGFTTNTPTGSEIHKENHWRRVVVVLVFYSCGERPLQLWLGTEWWKSQLTRKIMGFR